MTSVEADSYIAIDIDPNDLAIIKQAADLNGVDVQDYIVTAALEAARAVIEAHDNAAEPPR